MDCSVQWLKSIRVTPPLDTRLKHHGYEPDCSFFFYWVLLKGLGTKLNVDRYSEVYFPPDIHKKAIRVVALGFGAGSSCEIT